MKHYRKITTICASITVLVTVFISCGFNPFSQNDHQHPSYDIAPAFLLDNSEICYIYDTTSVIFLPKEELFFVFNCRNSDDNPDMIDMVKIAVTKSLNDMELKPGTHINDYLYFKDATSYAIPPDISKRSLILDYAHHDMMFRESGVQTCVPWVSSDSLYRLSIRFPSITDHVCRNIEESPVDSLWFYLLNDMNHNQIVDSGEYYQFQIKFNTRVKEIFGENNRLRLPYHVKPGLFIENGKINKDTLPLPTNNPLIKDIQPDEKHAGYESRTDYILGTQNKYDDFQGIIHAMELQYCNSTKFLIYYSTLHKFDVIQDSKEIASYYYSLHTGEIIHNAHICKNNTITATLFENKKGDTDTIREYYILGDGRLIDIVTQMDDEGFEDVARKSIQQNIHLNYICKDHIGESLVEYIALLHDDPESREETDLYFAGKILVEFDHEDRYKVIPLTFDGKEHIENPDGVELAYCFTHSYSEEEDDEVLLVITHHSYYNDSIPEGLFDIYQYSLSKGEYDNDRYVFEHYPYKNIEGIETVKKLRAKMAELGM